MPLPASRNQIERAGPKLRRAAREGVEPAPRVLEVIDEFRGWHVETVQRVQRELAAFFHDRAQIEEEHLPITSRLKTPGAIRRKLLRSPTSLVRMQDIAGARIVVATLEIQDAVCEVLDQTLFRGSVATVKDQREEPDQFGYRAMHVIIRLDERLAEVQIRTQWQDRWAQLVERYDAANKTDLKHGRGPAEWLEWLHATSDEFRNADLGKPFEVPPTPFDEALAAERESEEAEKPE